MAEFDQPALFDFVLKKTGVENVTYIGHSQGTMQMFAALCENLDFFKPKLNLVIMLAPVTRLTSVSTKRLQFLADHKFLIDRLRKKGPELFKKPTIEGKVKNALGVMTNVVNIIFSTGDVNPKLLSEKAVDAILGHFPAGASFRSAEHFL